MNTTKLEPVDRDLTVAVIATCTICEKTMRRGDKCTTARDVDGMNLVLCAECAESWIPKLSTETFTSRDSRRNWLGLDEISRPVQVAPFKNWQPAFGTISQKSLGAIAATFTPREIQRMQFMTYMARNYYINEG